ncbi:endonuclease [Mangrovimonas yunxiaonensis]|uniref:Endonuclease n=1 Tax=Mangrovimonas yunxiaonensis TaxID=1197477 RepID=A0A084TI94_9FLAO|nr:DNA/RNA non-specific endonuclease [Mangrovimonas yunxiaonensis]KFB00430.1 endonuclease [Mangrovimonas yunxiaonensis]GGH34794.1 endonuclease [Mangrovimonas yunxiaonensis]
MSKRTLYSILAILVLGGIYVFEAYLEHQEEQAVVSQGAQEKTLTNTFFLPTSTTGQVVHHKGFSLSYNETYEQAEWVAYELKKTQLVHANFKRPYFEIDPAVKTGAASWRNYKNSGYDRGHLCPAADREFDYDLYTETFFTSNISPQEHSFNSGIWNRLEQKVRYWASRYDGVYVVTGGVFTNNMKTIGQERVAVPKQFFKIVLDYNQNKPKVLAFLMPHKNSDGPLYRFVVSVDSLETLTGIDFFPELEDRIEAEIEASDSYKNWHF